MTNPTPDDSSALAAACLVCGFIGQIRRSHEEMVEDLRTHACVTSPGSLIGELVPWLRVQLDLDEAHAQKDLLCVERATANGQWEIHYGYNLPYSIIRADGREIGRMTADHNAQRSVPDGTWGAEGDAMLVGRMVRSARRRAQVVLREVEAKRRIIAEHNATSLESCEVDNRAWPCPTVRLLALPYADRPGYRNEWAP